MEIVTNVTITPLEQSEIEIAGEIPLAAVPDYRKQALAALGGSTNVPGFRPGNVPEAVLEKHLGEEKVLWETAQRALQDAYVQVIREKQLDVVGTPHVTITKLAKDNPIGFKIRTAVLPEITLPDYKTLAAHIMNAPEEDMSVSDKEVSEVIDEIRKTRAQTQSRQETSEENPKEAPGGNLPELTDDFVKTLGDFTNVIDFKSKITENLKKEKQIRAKEKRRIQKSEKLIDGAHMTVPVVLVESELHTMLSQFRNNVERMGMQFDQYLKQSGKSEEALREEWRDSAEKRAKLQLILNAVAKQEHLHPSPEEIEREVSHIVGHYKDANPENTRIYVNSILTNEKVFQFLEEQEKKSA